MDIDRSNQDDEYSIDRHNETGSVNDPTSDLRDANRPHRWGIGERGAVGVISKQSRGAEGHCEGNTDTETELAMDTMKMLDGILQEFSEISRL